MTDSLSPEERLLIDSLIDHDKSLTDSERSDERRQHRESMYVEQLQRQLKHMGEHVPSFLMAMQARNNYRVACSLWPDDMAHVLRDEFIEQVMRSSERCLSCHKELPMPYDDREHCDKCIEEIELIADNET